MMHKHFYWIDQDHETPNLYDDDNIMYYIKINGKWEGVMK